MCGEEKEEVEEAGGGGGKKGLMRKVNFSDVRQVLIYIYMYICIVGTVVSNDIAASAIKVEPK